MGLELELELELELRELASEPWLSSESSESSESPESPEPSESSESVSGAQHSPHTKPLESKAKALPATPKESGSATPKESHWDEARAEIIDSAT